VAGKAQGFMYRRAHFDGRPGVFAVGASRNIERVELFRKMDALMGSAMLMTRRAASSWLTEIPRDTKSACRVSISVRHGPIMSGRSNSSAG